MSDINNKQNQETLFQSGEVQQLVYRNLKDYAIFTMDLQGSLTSWNPGIKEVLGYTEEEFIGRPAAMLFTPEHRAQSVPEREREIAAKEGRVDDTRWHIRQDGSLIWVNGICTALYDDSGNLHGFVKIMRDQTDKKQLEEELEQRVAERTRELRQAKQHFEQVFRIGPFAAVITTMGKEHQFLDANESFTRLTGYTREEVVGKTNYDLGMWSSPNEAEKMHQALTQEGSISETELTVTTSDGEARAIIASAAVLKDGEPVVVRMFYDITERKRNEQQLSQAIQEVMKDAAWFSSAVVEKLANIRSGRIDATEVAELTPRERQVLERIASGMNNDEIGRDLGISSQTVRNYISIIYDKVGVRTRAEAVVWARERGLVGP